MTKTSEKTTDAGSFDEQDAKPQASSVASVASLSIEGDERAEVNAFADTHPSLEEMIDADALAVATTQEEEVETTLPSGVESTDELPALDASVRRGARGCDDTAPILDAVEDLVLPKVDSRGEFPEEEEQPEPVQSASSFGLGDFSERDVTDVGLSTLPELEGEDRGDHTKELPVLRAEELWFVHEKTPRKLSLNEVLHVPETGLEVKIVRFLLQQAFERRMVVTLGDDPRPRLLKQASASAPFARYALEHRMLTEIAEEEPCEGLPVSYACWEDEGDQFLVSDLPVGQPYATLIDEESIGSLFHANVLRQLTYLIDRVHRFGFVLTSLRPSAFSVERRGAEVFVHISDFMNLCETVERPLYPLATPFSAPELAELVPADEGVDLYSLGALLHRSLTKEDAPVSYIDRLFQPDCPRAGSPMVYQILTRTLSAPSERFFDISELDKAFAQLERELTPRIRVEVAMRSSTGINPLRIVNQDSGAYFELKSNHRSEQRHVGYYVVADGMGGHEDGDRASELAVQGAIRRFQELAMELSFPVWREKIDALSRDLAGAASRNLVETVAMEGGGRRMGTTFTAMLVVNDKMALSHLGDSRAILYRAGKLEVLSEDHSLVGMMVKAGQMTVEQAEAADEKNILMRSLGADQVVRPELFDGFEVTQGNAVLRAQGGDKIVLVSDGVWGMIPRTDMGEIFASASGPGDLSDKLCREAIARGGSDNVIVISLFISDEEAF